MPRVGGILTMEIKTCEQYVLARLEEARRENEALKARVEELDAEVARMGAKQAESPDGEIEPRQVQMVRANEPLETVCLTVKDVYDMRNTQNNLGLTAAEAREKASTEEGLLEVAEKRVGWCCDRCVNVETHLWPCQLRIGAHTFGLDLYDKGREIIYGLVREDGEPAETDQYFPTYRAEELRALGLELLKKNLLDYADKLDEQEKRKAGEEDE